MWNCKHCNEENEDTFDSCWKCHKDRASASAVSSTRSQPVSPEPPCITTPGKQPDNTQPPVIDPSPQPPFTTTPGTGTSGTVPSLSKRYKDTYTEAHAVVTVGKFIKGLGVFLFIAVLLAGFGMASDQGGRVAVIGVVLACLIGIPTYVLGILIAAQGQTQLATLDTAVNSSRHLSDDEVADILAKRFSL